MSNEEIDWESVEFPGSNTYEEGEYRNELHPEISKNANKLEIVRGLIKQNPFRRRMTPYGQEYYRLSKENPGYETKVLVPEGARLADYIVQRYDGKFPPLTRISRTKPKFGLVLETRVHNNERFAVLTARHIPEYKKLLHAGQGPDFRVYLDAKGILFAYVPYAVRKYIGLKKDRISAYAIEDHQYGPLTINMRQPGRPDIMLVTLEEEPPKEPGPKENAARIAEEAERYFKHLESRRMPNRGKSNPPPREEEVLVEQEPKPKNTRVYSTNVDPFKRRHTGKGSQYVAAANRLKKLEEYYKENLERQVQLAENRNEAIRKYYAGPKKSEPVKTGQYPVMPQRPRTAISKMVRGVKVSLEKLGEYLSGRKKKVVKGQKVNFEKFGGLVPLGAPYRPHVEIF
jgi:hypothetical protein